MDTARRFCFVLMPFKPELHYFFLYLRDHIEQTHHLRCERADDQVLTVPILDKILAAIRASDLIVADCTGRNPNVFYEIGMAHAYEKKVILITSDEIRETPSDIRHFEFIKYDLANHLEFLAKIDNAIRNILFEQYQGMDERALEILNAFRQASRVNPTAATRSVFLQRILNAETTSPLPMSDDSAGLAEFYLPKIIADIQDAATMMAITTHLSSFAD
jgi:hypothetical protein